MRTIEVELTLTEELLGTAPANPDLYRDFIESKRPAPEEGAEPQNDETETLPSVDEELQKATTVFHRTPDDRPFLYDYQFKGFMKDACSALRRATPKPKKGEASPDTGFLSPKLKAYKKEIDGLIFVMPRCVVAELPKGGAIGTCMRPLRAQTAQGERVSLARSETLPPGTKFKFKVKLLADHLEDLLYEWLEYGELKGLGCWRNSGKGRFSFAASSVNPSARVAK